MSPRPQLDHIRKPQLLAAAAEVIAERGLGGARIADIAERAGCSPAAVIYWFPTKDELLLGAIVASEDGFYADAEAVLGEIEDPVERLEALVAMLVADPEEPLWIELWSRSLREPDAAAARRRLDERWRELLARLIRDGAESGDFDVADPEATATTLGALIDGLSIQATLRDPSVADDGLGALIRESVGRLLGRPMRPAAVLEGRLG